MKCNSLKEVRENIDRIDDEIIKLIAERSTYVLQASKFKKNEEEVKSSKRVEQVIYKIRNKATKYNIDPDICEKIYREMISSFINIEINEFNKVE